MQMSARLPLAVLLMVTTLKFRKRAISIRLKYCKANVGQGSVGDDWMTVEQYGDFNTAEIEVVGDNNDVDIYQSGDNNDADSDVLNTSNGNNVDITQMNGNSNSASYKIGDGQNNSQTLMQDGSPKTLDTVPRGLI